MNNIVIYPSKTKMLACAIGSLLFVILSLYIAYNYETLNLKIIGYIGILLFSLGFVYPVYRLLSVKPSVIINDEGIFDNASAVGVGMLKWEEISEVSTYKIGGYGGQRVLGIVPKDKETIMERLPFIKRVMMSMNEELGFPPINIPQINLSISVDELLNRILEKIHLTTELPAHIVEILKAQQKEREHVEHLLSSVNMVTSTNQPFVILPEQHVILECSICRLPVTKVLKRLEDTSPLSDEDNADEDNADLLPAGFCIIGDGSYYSEPAGQLLINCEDAINTKYHPDQSRLVGGCCGLDGSNGMNLVCLNGHEVGTMRSDCWMDAGYSIAFTPEAITLNAF